ncbi:hypothetical protein D3C75_1327620 [compost metagenome]
MLKRGELLAMAIGSAELSVASEMVRESLRLRYGHRIYKVSSGEVRVDGGYEVLMEAPIMPYALSSGRCAISAVWS